LRHFRSRFRACPDVVPGNRRDSVVVNATDAWRIAWRRGDAGPTYVGAVSRGSEAIRLTGRDPVLGIDVALSIPIDEVGFVGVTEPAESADGAPCVILDLIDSEAIYLRPVGSIPMHVHLLARALGAVTRAPAVLAQGG
jgi:hypothetical protein